jgi:hypothetical protein
MQTLLERGLVEQVGRAEVIGRPITYGVTSMFLEYFGLKDLDDLPAADELRRIPVTRPESLLTADPGLATAPPEQLSLADSVPPSEATPPPSSDAGPATGSAAGSEPVSSSAATATAEAPAAPVRRRKFQASVELAQGAVQVSPGTSELPPTQGTASSAADGESSAVAETTETSSAEAPSRSRMNRRKKDPNPEA